MALTADQRAFLDEPHVAVAATIGPDGLPHQTVMWYLLDGDTLVLSTPRGSLKHRHLQRDPRLSVCVEDGFVYVTLSGRATLTEETEAERAIYHQVGARYRDQPPRRPARLDPRAADLLSRSRVTIRMTIERVSANSFG